MATWLHCYAHCTLVWQSCKTTPRKLAMKHLDSSHGNSKLFRFKWKKYSTTTTTSMYYIFSRRNFCFKSDAIHPWLLLFLLRFDPILGEFLSLGHDWQEPLLQALLLLYSTKVVEQSSKFVSIRQNQTRFATFKLVYFGVKIFWSIQKIKPVKTLELSLLYCFTTLVKNFL